MNFFRERKGQKEEYGLPAKQAKDHFFADRSKALQRTFSILLAAFMAAAVPAGVLAAQPEAVPADDSTHILFTNDVHSYIDGAIPYSVVAGTKQAIPNSILLDAGDHIQGNAYGSMDQGKTIVQLMNSAGYDAATMGNHEFDYGMERLLAVTQEANYDYLSCNFFNVDKGINKDLVLQPYKVFEINGMRIAVIGITTPESFTSSTPKYFQDDEGNYIYGIAGGENGSDLYQAVQNAIDAAENEGADYVIGLGHLGEDPNSDPWNSEDVISHTTGLDALIDGHSHTLNPGKEIQDQEGNPVVLAQTGSYLNNLGCMTITKEGDITSKMLSPEDLKEVPADPAVLDKEGEWMAQVDNELGSVIGTFVDPMVNFDEDGNRLVRSQETNTGDFCADALYSLFDKMDLPVDVAIINGGGIRNKNLQGDVTYRTCKEIHTFGNQACLQTVTGQQILDALEWGAQNAGSSESGGFLHVSGLKYTIDTSIPATIQSDEKGIWTGGPLGEYRVKNVQILDRKSGEYKPLDVNAKYNLAGYNYTLRDLGDGFGMFKGAVNVVDYVCEDYQVLARYIQTFENGQVTGYAKPQGRIQIVNGLDPEMLTVSFDLNGHGSSIEAQSVESGQCAKEPQAPAEKGYVFNGWFTDKECSQAYDFKTPVVSNLTLFAKWTAEKTPDPQTANYTLTFETNGGSKIEPIVNKEGTVVELKNFAPTKTGYTFAGWYLDSKLTTKASSTVTLSKDMTVYAKWTAVSQNSSSAVTPSNTTTPKTGVWNNPLLYAGICCAALAGLFWLLHLLQSSRK